mgnify:FL=1
MGHSPANGGVSTHIALSPKSAEMHMKGISDIAPLLDSTSLSEIKNSESHWSQIIQQIRTQVPENAEVDSNSTEDKNLAQAVEIAAELPKEVF